MAKKSDSLSPMELNNVNASQLAEHLTLNALTKHITFISGPPGSGKTQIVRQVAHTMGLTPVDFIASELLPEDLGGFVVPDTVARMARRLMPDVIGMIRETRETTGKPVMAFFDELTNGSNAVMAACFKLLHEGRAGGFSVPEDTVFVAAGNPPEVSSTAQDLPAPLLNRMAALNYEGPTFDEWQAHALGSRVHEAVLGFIRLNPNFLSKEANFNDGCPTPTPRSWMAVSDILKTITQQTKGKGVAFNPITRMGAIASRVGSKAAMAMEAALKYADRLHTWEDIKTDPDGISATTEFAPAYMQAVAMVSAIGENSGDDMKIALRYANRLPKEVLAVLVIGISKRPDGPVLRRAAVQIDSYRAVADMTAAGRSLKLNS